MSEKKVVRRGRLLINLNEMEKDGLEVNIREGVVDIFGFELVNMDYLDECLEEYYGLNRGEVEEVIEMVGGIIDMKVIKKYIRR